MDSIGNISGNQAKLYLNQNSRYITSSVKTTVKLYYSTVGIEFEVGGCMGHL